MNKAAKESINKSDAFDDKGKQLDAIAGLDEEIKIDPSNDRFNFLKGSNLSSPNRYSEAMMAYDKAISLNTSDASAYINQENAGVNLRKSKEAIAGTW